jgi:hypothetical protein
VTKRGTIGSIVGASERVIEARSAAVEACQLILMPGGGPPDKLYIAIDRTGVPIVAAETEGRDSKGEDGNGEDGKAEDGKAHDREVKMARRVHPGRR